MILATTKSRILQLLKHKGISKSDFFSKTSIKRGFLDGDKLDGSVSDFHLANIIAAFPDVNINWLLTGAGSMLRQSTATHEHLESGVPFYNFPVSAGHSTTDITATAQPDGYISNLPGADLAQAILPVTGMSMQPEIMPGALIGVRLINNWETLNTERIYMIITHDDRMIKRIEHDPANTDILWCISPNYQRFSIYKSDIIEIHRVCFVYNAK